MTIYQTLDMHGTKETWINTIPFLDNESGQYLFDSSKGRRAHKGHMFPCVLNPGEMIKVTATPMAMELVRQEGYYCATHGKRHFFIQYKDNKWFFDNGREIDGETIKLYKISNTPVPQSCLI